MTAPPREGLPTVAVIGLGYVGLPLAVAFGRQYPTIGFDVAREKLDSYRDHQDPSGEMASEDLRAATMLRYTDEAHALAAADFLVVAVPTPIDQAHRPDFAPLLLASEVVGRNLKPGAVIVFESTVYPGATEEVCIPALEKFSGRQWKRDFFVGYSPERINPGDRERTLTKITKVIAGDTPATLEVLERMYGSIIPAGLCRASSIRVAEAAKVIENTQRDLNIALMNELAIIFDKLGLDTTEVLQVAGSKWNFLPFRPGLVGGHCIGVDPYYLTHKADMLGYHPQVILAGRRINDGMGKFIAEQTIKCLAQNGSPLKGTPVIVLGLSFKEDCADLRNSRVIDVVRELAGYGVELAIHDPVCDARDAYRQYGVRLCEWEKLPRAAAIVACVAHRQFRQRPLADYAAKLSPGATVVDVKSQFDAEAFRAAGIKVWRL